MSDLPGGDRAKLDLLAEYYDWRHGAYEDDLPFYRNLAADAGGPVLELGCGTGRLLRGLAGLAPLIGVDISAGMLRRARASLPVKAGRGILLLQGDLRRPLVLDRAGLAILALNTFCHFDRREDQVAVLSSARQALRPGGTLALDLPNPHVELDGRPNGACLLESVEQREGETVYEWSVSEANPAEQTLTVRSLLDRVAGDGLLRRHSLEFRLRLFYRFELESLLLAAGLEPEGVLGDFDYSPYETDAPRLIALARRAH